MKKTPLYDCHLALKGKIIDFGGWALPVEYEGIFSETEAVRKAAGVFDVSHMGEYIVKGPDAEAYIQKLITNDITTITDGRIQYSPICYPDGGTVDDLLVYRFNGEHFLIVVNAGNCEKDGKWFEQHLFGETTLENISEATAQIAVQGPKAQTVLQKMTNEDLSQLKFFRFKADVDFNGTKALISRTGYTGEDGFELYLAAADAPKLWENILRTGKDDGAKPAGLGARDLLRFESCLPLYGQEISEKISPLTAGLDKFVKLEKADFIGKDALIREMSLGREKELIAFEMEGRAIPREHYPIMDASGKIIGEVTHGTFSQGLQKSIGLGYVSRGAVAPGDKIEISIRNKNWSAVVIEKPFYRKKYAK